MANFDLELSFTSRMNATSLLEKDGKVFFGRWTPPQIALDGNEAKVLVTEQDKGTLDFIAYKYLGTRELFWAIALVNKISHIPSEVITGLTLTIPKINNVYAALQKADNRG